MAPLRVLIIVIYLHVARGNTFIEEPFSVEASDNSDYDRPYDNLYRVLIGNTQFDYNTGNEYNHVLRDGAVDIKPHYLEELEKRKEQRKLRIIQVNHMKRFNELIPYLRDHMQSTEYFYNEMKRIQRQHKVKDLLRTVVEDADNNPAMKKKILSCYYNYKDLEPKACQLMKCKKPNTLTIQDILPHDV